MVKTIYKIVTAYHIEDLVNELNAEENAEWRIVATIQEHAYTKVILEKEYE